MFNSNKKNISRAPLFVLLKDYKNRQVWRKAIAHAALRKQSTIPVDNSVSNMLINVFDGHIMRLCYKLMVFSPNL